MRNFKLGENDSYSIMHFLFYTGLVVVAYRAIQFGKYIRLKSMAEKLQENVLNFPQLGASGMITTAWDTIMGILFGIAYLIIIAFIWRFVCEMLLIFLRYCESNTNKSNK